MTNATDIITYVGIPLAVLGVLPILYTFCFAILQQRRIRHKLLHHGHRPLTSTRHDGFSIRSSPMTSLIEIDLPRYTIAPLDRHSKEYWQLSGDGHGTDHERDKLLARAESTLSMIEEGRVQGYLRGGSWRAFNWRRLVVGKKLYRIQYEDELCEPPAEMDFSDLIHFLLDWGAVPDAMGWQKLRSGGLWTPTGTVLLRATTETNEVRKQPDDWVLRTSMPNDSDGILTLCVRWPGESDNVELIRGAASLPPGWGRLRTPLLLHAEDKVSTDRVDLSARIEQYRNASKHKFDNGTHDSIRFRVESGLVTQVLWEYEDVDTGLGSDLFHLARHSAGQQWFTSIASALVSRNGSTGLWGFAVPTEIAAFVRKDSVPCGVLVLLGILEDAAAPQWTSENSTSNQDPHCAMRFHQQCEARRAAERLEATMPPEQARIHKTSRLAQERQQQMNDVMAQAHARKEREERRLNDAIASPRMSIRATAEACLAWLISQGEIGRTWTIEQVAEAVLFVLVVDEQENGEADRLLNVLEEWQSWANAGGMKKQQFDMLQRNIVEFCLAASVVVVVQEACHNGNTDAGTDMLECLRLWRKVRLG